jgi:uracil-DNA glycosylase
MSLEQNMGKEWYQLLSPFIQSDTFQKLTTFIQNEYRTKIIYPEKENVFKAFRLCPFDKVKVVFLGHEQYSKHYMANGLSYGVNYKITHVPTSLDYILQELENNLDRRIFLDFDYSFESWATQGVFMYNTALTVIKNKPGSHNSEWIDFNKAVFDALNTYHTGIIFVLLGNDIKHYKNMIGKNHHIIEVPHPAAEGYSGRTSGFLGSNLFNNINNILQSMNGKQGGIKWI